MQMWTWTHKLLPSKPHKQTLDNDSIGMGLCLTTSIAILCVLSVWVVIAQLQWGVLVGVSLTLATLLNRYKVTLHVPCVYLQCKAVL